MSNGTASFEYFGNVDCGGGQVGDGGLTHLCAIADGLGGQGLVYFTVNGEMCDGGDESNGGQPKGFEHLFGSVEGDVNGRSEDGIRVGDLRNGKVKSVRVWDRALRTNEATGGYRAGL